MALFISIIFWQIVILLVTISVFGTLFYYVINALRKYLKED